MEVGNSSNLLLERSNSFNEESEPIASGNVFNRLLLKSKISNAFKFPKSSGSSFNWLSNKSNSFNNKRLLRVAGRLSISFRSKFKISNAVKFPIDSGSFFRLFRSNLNTLSEPNLLKSGKIVNLLLVSSSLNKELRNAIDLGISVKKFEAKLKFSNEFNEPMDSGKLDNLLDESPKYLRLVNLPIESGTEIK